MQTTFICPQTSAALSFDLPADEAALPALWSRPLKINCPVCQTIHTMDYKNAYIVGGMSEFVCIPADVKQRVGRNSDQRVYARLQRAMAYSAD